MVLEPVLCPHCGSDNVVNMEKARRARNATPARMTNAHMAPFSVTILIGDAGLKPNARSLKSHSMGVVSAIRHEFYKLVRLLSLKN